MLQLRKPCSAPLQGLPRLVGQLFNDFVGLLNIAGPKWFDENRKSSSLGNCQPGVQCSRRHRNDIVSGIISAQALHLSPLKSPQAAANDRLGLRCPVNHCKRQLAAQQASATGEGGGHVHPQPARSQQTFCDATEHPYSVLKVVSEWSGPRSSS